MHRTFLGEFASVAVVAFTTLAVVGRGTWITASLIAIVIVALALVEVRADSLHPRRALIAATVVAGVLTAVWHPALLVPLITGVAMLMAVPRTPQGGSVTGARRRHTNLTSERMFANVVASSRSDATRAEGGFRDDDAALPQRDRVLAPPLESRV